MYRDDSGNPVTYRYLRWLESRRARGGDHYAPPGAGRRSFIKPVGRRDCYRPHYPPGWQPPRRRFSHQSTPTYPAYSWQLPQWHFNFQGSAGVLYGSASSNPFNNNRRRLGSSSETTQYSSHGILGNAVPAPAYGGFLGVRYGGQYQPTLAYRPQQSYQDHREHPSTWEQSGNSTDTSASYSGVPVMHGYNWGEQTQGIWAQQGVGDFEMVD